MRRRRVRRARPEFATGHYLYCTLLDAALESGHDALLDEVPRPGDQQAESDQVGQDPRREEERPPRKHGHTVHDGLPRYPPIREIMAQPPHGPEPLRTRQHGTPNTSEND